jgi:hypothetical protein
MTTSTLKQDIYKKIDELEALLMQTTCEGISYINEKTYTQCANWAEDINEAIEALSENVEYYID